jgi:hypothetical protein
MERTLADARLGRTERMDAFRRLARLGAARRRAATGRLA